MVVYNHRKNQKRKKKLKFGTQTLTVIPWQVLHIENHYHIYPAFILFIFFSFSSIYIYIYFKIANNTALMNFRMVPVMAYSTMLLWEEILQVYLYPILILQSLITLDIICVFFIRFMHFLNCDNLSMIFCSIAFFIIFVESVHFDMSALF